MNRVSRKIRFYIRTIIHACTHPHTQCLFFFFFFYLFIYLFFFFFFFFLLNSKHTFKSIIITKTSLYNFDPLKPHFYIVKLWCTGVYVIFLISVQNIDCGYPLEPPHRGGSNEYPQSVLCRNMKKFCYFSSEN